MRNVPSRGRIFLTAISAFAVVYLISISPAHAELAPTEVAKLLASDAFAADQFGYSVAVSGDTAVVGVP
jgi:hypothetical protein